MLSDMNIPKSIYSSAYRLELFLVWVSNRNEEPEDVHIRGIVQPVFFF